MKKSLSIFGWTILYGIIGMFCFKMTVSQYWVGFVFGAGWACIQVLL